MPFKRVKNIGGSRKAALINSVKAQLTDGTLWEEYSEDDLIHYVAERHFLTYEKAMIVICGIKFIIDLEEELLVRKAKNRICDCVPMLSPYITSFASLCQMSRTTRVVYKATPYTVMGIASIATIRLFYMGDRRYIAKVGQGIPSLVSYYLAHPRNIREQHLMHNALAYGCHFCNKKYRPFYSKNMSRLLTNMSIFIYKASYMDVYKYGKPYVEIDKPND